MAAKTEALRGKWPRDKVGQSIAQAAGSRRVAAAVGKGSVSENAVCSLGFF